MSAGSQITELRKAVRWLLRYAHTHDAGFCKPGHCGCGLEKARAEAERLLGRAASKKAMKRKPRVPKHPAPAGPSPMIIMGDPQAVSDKKTLRDVDADDAGDDGKTAEERDWLDRFWSTSSMFPNADPTND